MNDPLTAAIESSLSELSDSPVEQPTPPEATVETVEDTEAPEGDEVELEGEDGLDAGDEGSEGDEDAAEPEDVEDEAEEAEDETDDNDEAAVEIDPEASYTLPDGSKVSGAELRNGFLRQADYTRKTQEAARVRKEADELISQVKDWYETRAANPGEWIAEIAGETENPAAAVAAAIGTAGDATQSTTVLAYVVKALAEAGKLDEQFSRAFGVEELVASRADKYDSTNEVQQLRKRLDEREADEQRRIEEQRTQEIVAQYEQQWQAIKAADQVSYETPEDEAAAKVALLTFARDKGIPDLEAAWVVMRHQTGQGVPAASQPARQDKAADEAARKALAKKRASRAIAKRTPPGGTPQPRTPGDLDAAVSEVLAERGIDLS